MWGLDRNWLRRRSIRKNKAAPERNGFEYDSTGNIAKAQAIVDEMVIREIPDPEDGPPRYSDKGRILVDIEPTIPGVYKWGYEVLDYDPFSSVFWINEGTGFDYWLDTIDFPGPGRYLIAGIYGSFSPGDGWEIEGSEDWYFDDPVLCPCNNLNELDFQTNQTHEPH